MSFPVRVIKRTPMQIVPDGQVYGRFYEPGEIATGEAAKVVLEWGCGEEIVPERAPAPQTSAPPPAAPDDGLDALTVAELRERCAALGIDDAPLRKKAEIIEAVRAALAAQPTAV